MICFCATRRQGRPQTKGRHASVDSMQCGPNKTDVMRHTCAKEGLQLTRGHLSTWRPLNSAGVGPATSAPTIRSILHPQSNALHTLRRRVRVSGITAGSAHAARPSNKDGGVEHRTAWLPALGEHRVLASLVSQDRICCPHTNTRIWVIAARAA